MELGIDLGNCFSSVQMKINERIFDLEGARGVPTLFMYNPDTGENLFGDQCKGQMYAFLHPKDVIRYIKTLARTNPTKLNDPKAISSGGKCFSYRDVIKLYLEHLISRAKEDANRMLGRDEPIDSVCIAAPVASDKGGMLSTEYRDMLQKVLEEITGLSKEHIFVRSEPVVAATHYFSELYKSDDVDEETVLVFDLGGGTLDVTLMTYSCEDDTVYHSEKIIDGLPDLGGKDWDEAFGRFLLREKFHLNPDNPGFVSEAEKYEFEDEVTKAKEELSNMPIKPFSCFIDDEPKLARVTAEEFERATSDLCTRAMALTKKVADSYDGEIDKILLVGGSSNMPQIRKAIEKTFPYFDKEDILLFEPSKAVAKGAAMYTALVDPDIVGGGSETGTHIVKIAEKTYGWGSTNSTKFPPKEMIYNVVMRNTEFLEDTISVESDSAFHAIRDDQTEILFTAYESEVTKEECEDGHWSELTSSQRKCGIEITVPVPSHYRKKARDFNLYPKMILDKNGILIFEMRDENGKLLASKQTNLYK